MYSLQYPQWLLSPYTYSPYSKDKTIYIHTCYGGFAGNGSFEVNCMQPTVSITTFTDVCNASCSSSLTSTNVGSLFKRSIVGSCGNQGSLHGTINTRLLKPKLLSHICHVLKRFGPFDCGFITFSKLYCKRDRRKPCIYHIFFVRNVLF